MGGGWKASNLRLFFDIPLGDSADGQPGAGLMRGKESKDGSCGRFDFYRTGSGVFFSQLLVYRGMRKTKEVAP